MIMKRCAERCCKTIGQWTKRNVIFHFSLLSEFLHQYNYRDIFMSSLPRSHVFLWWTRYPPPRILSLRYLFVKIKTKSIFMIWWWSVKYITISNHTNIYFHIDSYTSTPHFRRIGRLCGFTNLLFISVKIVGWSFWFSFLMTFSICDELMLLLHFQ